MEGPFTCVWTMLKMHVHVLIAEHTSCFSWHKSEQLSVVGGGCYTGQQKSRFSTWQAHVGFPKPLVGFPRPSLRLFKAIESGGQGGLRLVLRDTFYTPAFPDLLTVCKATGSCNKAPTRLLQLTRQCSRRQTAVTDSDRFNGRTQRFRSRGNHDHGGHFSRGGKSADGLKTMLAADRDREASSPLTPSLPHPSMEVGRAAVPL